MNEKLIKELIDAGFNTNNVTRLDVVSEFRGFVIPLLTELIEACGDEFYSVVRALENDWRAFSDRDSKNTVGTADGKTPEEAVARLWLALNKK